MDQDSRNHEHGEDEGDDHAGHDTRRLVRGPTAHEGSDDVSGQDTATVLTSSGIMNEWLRTALPMRVVPVSSTATAASCVALAGRKSTPEVACHIATTCATPG